MIAVPCCESIGMAVSLTVMLCDGLQIAQLRMNVDSMDQSHRETKVKYETDLANLREQVAVQHNSHNHATIFLTCLGQLVFFCGYTMKLLIGFCRHASTTHLPVTAFSAL